jgi:hypothetical protein
MMKELNKKEFVMKQKERLVKKRIDYDEEIASGRRPPRGPPVARDSRPRPQAEAQPSGAEVEMVEVMTARMKTMTRTMTRIRRTHPEASPADVPLRVEQCDARLFAKTKRSLYRLSLPSPACQLGRRN